MQLGLCHGQHCFYLCDTTLQRSLNAAQLRQRQLHLPAVQLAFFRDSFLNVGPCMESLHEVSEYLENLRLFDVMKLLLRANHLLQVILMSRGSLAQSLLQLSLPLAALFVHLNIVL